MYSIHRTIPLVLIATLVISFLPAPIAAQVQALDQALKLVKEAEDEAKDKNIKEQLKNIRKGLERAHDLRKDNKGEQSAQEVGTARSSLRNIIDSPGNESDALQEKMAEALRLLQDSMVALGEVKATAETEFGLHTTSFDT